MRKWLLMTKTRFVRYLFALCLAAFIAFQAQANYSAAQLDVVYYDVTIEPDIAAKTIKGTVAIAFVSQADQVEFDCGELVIDSVRRGRRPLKFSVANRRLKNPTRIRFKRTSTRDRLSRRT